ncbi:MAG: hypothetical protein RIR36_1270, partial [Bacteroidota bacterium]
MLAQESNKNSRRNFIGATVKAAVVTALTGSQLHALASNDKAASVLAEAVSPTLVGTSFTQLPLPYAYNALEPFIDALTMEIHYSKHAATYAKNVQDAAAAENVNTNSNLETILQKI